MRPVVFSSLLLLLLSACGDSSDEELTKGEYFVSHYADENTGSEANALLSYMDSTKTGFKVVKMVRWDSSIRLLMEGEFTNATEHEQGLYAARLARQLSREVFNGQTCSIILVSSIDGDGSMHNPTGWSHDKRLDSLDKLTAF